MSTCGFLITDPNMCRVIYFCQPIEICASAHMGFPPDLELQVRVVRVLLRVKRRERRRRGGYWRRGHKRQLGKRRKPELKRKISLRGQTLGCSRPSAEDSSLGSHRRYRTERGISARSV
jgi:hypothetical protein